MERNQLKTVESVVEFIFAGNATITLESEKTGKWFTYKIVAVENKPDQYFVKYLAGTDNESDYQYLGMIRPHSFLDAHGYKLFITRASRVSQGTPVFMALDYVLQSLFCNHFPANCKIWHEGRCGRCGRKLTVPESIESGLGPECRRKMGE